VAPNSENGKENIILGAGFSNNSNSKWVISLIKVDAVDFSLKTLSIKYNNGSYYNNKTDY